MHAPATIPKLSTPAPAPPPAASSMLHRFPLRTGLLELRLDAMPALPLEDCLHVASRQNPKRGFLFVSHLLGKHVPVDLATLRRTHADLARQVLADLPAAPGTVLVIGMAETATLLGYGVWRTLARALCDSANPDPCLFLQTTRYRTAGPAWSFEESHSHAPQQWLHGLDDPRLASVRHVVLVDDELSTGHTFEALEAVLRARLPGITTVQWTCLTDFRPPQHRRHPASSLLRGAWTFAANGTVTLPPSALAACPVDPALLQCDYGRASPLDQATRAAILPRIQALAAPIRRIARGRVLVVGTGEFMPLPFELAEELEKTPAVTEVLFQATTRSPADMPGLALGPDHYGEAVPQFLYNFDRTAFDTVVVVAETPASPALGSLASRLGATLVTAAHHPS